MVAVDDAVAFIAWIPRLQAAPSDPLRIRAQELLRECRRKLAEADLSEPTRSDVMLALGHGIDSAVLAMRGFDTAGFQDWEKTLLAGPDGGTKVSQAAKQIVDRNDYEAGNVFLHLWLLGTVNCELPNDWARDNKSQAPAQQSSDSRQRVAGVGPRPWTRLWPLLLGSVAGVFGAAAFVIWSN